MGDHLQTLTWFVWLFFCYRMIVWVYQGGLSEIEPSPGVVRCFVRVVFLGFVCGVVHLWIDFIAGIFSVFE